MIEVIFFSIAGSGHVDSIDALLSKWQESSVIPAEYKPHIKYTLDIVEEGEQYPAATYYATYFNDSGQRFASVAEILHYAKQVEDFFGRQKIQGDIIKVFNEGATLKECISKINEITEGTNTTNTDEFQQPVMYSDTLVNPYDGIKFFIDPVDNLTGGIARGQVATIAAFTAHGKSTAWLSILYANAKRGRKCVYFSLELPLYIVWLELQTRYYYEEKHMQVTTTDLIQQKLNKEQTELVKSYEADFKRDIAANIYVCDSSELPADGVPTRATWLQLYRKWDSFLGGLDLVVHDHVGQYNLLYKDMGNHIIKQLQDVTVRFRSIKDNKACVTGFAVQCNREGYRYARRNNGVYDMTAIGDLNEIERTSAYVVFMFTSEESKIMQETVITTNKTRLGPTNLEPTPVAFLPAVITVGSTVEMVSYGDDFSDMGDDFGSSSGGLSQLLNDDDNF